MLSSTVRDLFPDRTIALDTLQATGLVNTIGVTPVRGVSHGGSSFLTTIEMAENCHLYLLLLGRRYGFITERDMSATELEFEAAYRDDPTKILVFLKKVNRIEARQRAFIDRVTDYHKGYYVSSYGEASDLQEVLLFSFRKWVIDRAAIGAKLNYFDHFIRLAIQRRPFPGVQPEYTISTSHLELKYRIVGKVYAIQFDKVHIYRDFWGCLVTLQERFDAWREAQYGRNP